MDTLTATPQPDASAAEPQQDPLANYRNHAKIKDHVNEKVAEWSRGRELILRADWRNILYWRAIQWIKFDRSQNRFRPVILPRNWPTPVTNRFRSTIDSVISLVARLEPRLKFPPATDDPEDRATADIADRAIQVIEDEVGIRPVRQYLATWVGLTGGAWIETGYDPDPRWGTVPMDTGEIDAQGQPVVQQVPRGKMYVDVVPKFEMFFDPSIPMWSRQTQYCRRKSLSEDEAKRRWPTITEQIKPDSMALEAEMYGDALPTLGPNVEDNRGMRGMAGVTTALMNTRVTEQWFWSLPTQDYPEGLLAILIGREVVAYAGPLPYRARQADGSERPFLPHVFFPMKLVPGSAWPLTVADDLAIKQTQRNRIEALCELILMRTANPVWLLPQGSNVTGLTGEPGQHIVWNALGPSPAKPERIPGQNIPASVIRMLEQIDRDMEELSANYDVLKGDRPPGVTAGITLQLLQERGMSRNAPMFILWEAAWAEWGRQALEIFRQFASEERLLQIKGKDGTWQVQKFVGADLTGSINVVPEAGSALPRSSLTDRAIIEQLLGAGILNPLDPDTRLEILEEFGMLSRFAPAMANDTKNAIMENEAFEALAGHPVLANMAPDEMQGLMQMLAVDPAQVVQRLGEFQIQVPRVRPAVDDHAIHSREHGKDLKSESSQKLPIVIQLLKEAHKAEHDRLLSIQMQALQPMLGGGGGGGPPGPEPGSAPKPGNPLRSSSSPQRMAGDEREMGRDLTAGAGV